MYVLTVNLLLGCAKIISMNETSCLFCKIIAGEIPCEKLYQDEYAVAFLDHKPINPGHTLVIPINHHKNILETPDETLMHMMSTVKKVAATFKEVLGTENLNIGVNTGADAGQVVFHTHIHVMPRHDGDGYKLWRGKDYEEGAAKILAEKMRKLLS